MNYVLFELAGFIKPYEEIILFPSMRRYKENMTIFHRNDHHTILRVPKVLFKKQFYFNRSRNYYVNPCGLTYGELMDLGAKVEVWETNASGETELIYFN
jgi:hypothetical protein